MPGRSTQPIIDEIIKYGKKKKNDSSKLIKNKYVKDDRLVKTLNLHHTVIPAEAGIH